MTIKLESSKFFKLIINFGFVLLSILILCVKTYYLIVQDRYLAYGYDSLRLLGYTQQLIKIGEIDLLSASRIGLPFFNLAINKIFSLPPSQMLEPLIWLCTFGSVIFIWISIKLAYQESLFASICALLFTALYLPNPINYSNFTTFFLFPLRLCLLLLISRTTISPAKEKILGYLYYLSVLFSVANYPIFALLFDLIFGFVFIGEKKLKLYLAVQPIILFLYFSFIYQTYQFSLTFYQLIERMFSLVESGITSTQMFLFLVAYLSFHLLLFSNKLIYQVHKHYTLFHLHLPTIITTSVVFFLLISPQLFIEHTSFIWSSASTQNFNNLSKQFLFVILFLSVKIKAKVSSASPLYPLYVLTVLFSLIVLISGENHVTKILNNERFLLVFTLSGVLTFSEIIIRYKVWASLISTIIIYALINGFMNIPQMGYRPANPHILSSMDWFQSQPNNVNTLFISNYYRQENVAIQERPYGAYLNGTSIPTEDQTFLGKCNQPASYQCNKAIVDYAQLHAISYLVLEEKFPEDQQNFFVKQGQIIYTNDQVSIIKL